MSINKLLLLNNYEVKTKYQNHYLSALWRTVNKNTKHESKSYILIPSCCYLWINTFNNKKLTKWHVYNALKTQILNTWLILKKILSLATQYLLEETKEIYLCMALYELIFLKNFRIFIGYDIFSNYITSRKISNYALPYSKKIKLQKMLGFIIWSNYFKRTILSRYKIKHLRWEFDL